MAQRDDEPDDFEELIRESQEQVEKPPSRRAKPGNWALVASISAVLVGVGAIVAALIANSAGGTAPAPVEAAPEPAEPPVVLFETPEQGRQARPEHSVDPQWVSRVADDTGIPERALTAYATAAARISAERPDCGLGWNTLAGIGFVESEHGTIGGSQISRQGTAVPPIFGIPLDGTSTQRIPDTDGGRLDGDTVWDRAVGPMQFIPSTWAEWGADGDGDGLADTQNIDDSAYSAARYLCAVGGDLRDPERWIAAVAAYNDTVEYNNLVADAASHYAAQVG